MKMVSLIFLVSVSFLVFTYHFPQIYHIITANTRYISHIFTVFITLHNLKPFSFMHYIQNFRKQ